jgi:predicted dehydrogenase
MSSTSDKSLGIALIGCGGIALANHIPGVMTTKTAKIVVLCDSNPDALARASAQTGITDTTTNFEDVLVRDDVDAVIIATPNFLHAPIAQAAIRAGKHVMCEKPIAMNASDALAMAKAADAANLRHMTAFTYRFVPAMRYIAHLVGEGFLGTPYHFRAQRFQDWGTRAVGWRQVKKLAGSGEIGDMASHRIDFGHMLMGDLSRIVSHTKRWLDERDGQPNDLDDWVAILGEFTNGATAVWESSKHVTARGEGGQSPDVCEVNGSDGTLVYQLGKPLEIQIGRKGDKGLHSIPVPEDFLKHPASPRDPAEGDPLRTFRYDQDAEFIDAILNERQCSPSFWDGARAQIVIDAALESSDERAWVPISYGPAKT